MKICVIVASIGRPVEIKNLISVLERQTRKPDKIVLSVEAIGDAPENLGGAAEIIYGSRGASIQRNRGINSTIDSHDILVFLDDDFVPCDDFLEAIIYLFEHNSKIAGATGLVIADGVTTGGIAFDDAVRLASRHKKTTKSDVFIRDVHYAYGCNMAFRAEAIRYIRFDENLPLHSWQEDVDFAAQVCLVGRMVHTNIFAGVHCGVVKSRSSGKRVGYSQVANPVYLLNKGTMRPTHAFRLLARNLLANHLKMLNAEKHIDRRGRVVGNWRAIYDWLRGKCRPGNIINLD